MNGKRTSTSRDFMIAVTGVIISIAGIVYIIKQYSKLLSYLLTTADESNAEQKEHLEKRMNYQLKQFYSEEESEDIDADDDGQLSAIID